MAQRRRREQQIKQQQRTITILCVAGGLAAMLISLILCILIFDPFPKNTGEAAPISTALPYDALSLFTIGDLTTAQINEIRKNGRMRVSDGPRGVSVGDPLVKLLEKYPATFTGTSSGTQNIAAQSDEDLLLYCTNYLESQNERENTGMQSDEEIILYCASYFQNQNGHMTALPPRGLINTDGGEIIVTLLAPTSAYPTGTRDSYGSYEHVYCVYTIEAETMTVSSIILGIDQ